MKNQNTERKVNGFEINRNNSMIALKDEEFEYCEGQNMLLGWNEDGSARLDMDLVAQYRAFSALDIYISENKMWKIIELCKEDIKAIIAHSYKSQEAKEAESNIDYVFGLIEDIHNGTVDEDTEKTDHMVAYLRSLLA